MKNLIGNFAKYSVAGLLMIVLFGPTYGLALLGGEPLYSHEAEIAQNSQTTGHAEKPDASPQSDGDDTRQQRVTGYESKACADKENDICLSTK